MLIAVWPLVIALVGVVVYALASSKVSTIGLVAYAVGLFWLVAGLAGKTLHL